MVICHAVWLYHRFSLSFRDVEDLLAERGITVTYETIRQWCLTFAASSTRDGFGPGAVARATPGIWINGSSGFDLWSERSRP